MSIAKPIFTDWQDRNRLLWGQQPQRLAHNLHESPLFGPDALAALIEKYPKESYNLVHMGAQGEKASWREGHIGGASGQEVLEAIGQGRMWINLRDVMYVDSRYADLLKEVFLELEERIPGFDTFEHKCGILISSPKAQVYYHIDLPGQALWQLVGRKRVYLYPATAPFLTPEQLESTALFDLDLDRTYQDWYDEHAMVFDIKPGQMLHWPINAPHRVENHDCLNVSMTMEYWTDEIRRRHVINVANGLLRHRFGLTPRSRALEGPLFLGKKAMQGVMRRAGWVKRVRRARRPIDFKLDRARPGAIVDLAKAA